MYKLKINAILIWYPQRKKLTCKGCFGSVCLFLSVWSYNWITIKSVKESPSLSFLVSYLRYFHWFLLNLAIEISKVFLNYVLEEKLWTTDFEAKPTVSLVLNKTQHYAFVCYFRKFPYEYMTPCILHQSKSKHWFLFLQQCSSVVGIIIDIIFRKSVN